VLADGVLPYTPQYPLWSDGASKQRFVYLPEGERIDATDPDRWVFPVGTRFYKTFALGAQKLETRVLTKLDNQPGYASWSIATYAWSADQLHATLAPDQGVPHAQGTLFNIPAQGACWECHSQHGHDLARDPVLGFGAIQLNGAGPGVTLKTLLDRQQLSYGLSLRPVTPQNAVVPGDALARAALGYLHGNCGHCHGGSAAIAGLRLATEVGGSADVRDAPAYRSAVCQCLSNWFGSPYTPAQTYQRRIAPGDAAHSGLLARMSIRDHREGEHQQMPPFGTEQIDVQGLATVRAFIDALDPTSCDTSSAPACR
jgi:hypothetical protein